MRLGPALAIVLCLIVIVLRPVWPGETGARLTGVYDWSAPGIGGLSALVIEADGTRATVLTDRGTLFQTTVLRAGDNITGIEIDGQVQLSDENNRRFANRRSDSEGMAKTTDGALFISFEQDHSLRRYDLTRGRTIRLPVPDAFADFGRNTGMEALAIDAQGRLYTLPERPRSGRQGFPVWRWDGAYWERAFFLRKRAGFLAVSADIGPDGHFYLLERRVTFLGFQSRLRRWTLAPDGPEDEFALFTSRPGQFGNLEGLSLWRDGTGRLVVSMVADNNFWSVMRTQIVEYVLTE